MATRVIHRATCRLCLSKDVHRVVELAPVPLAEKYSDSPGDARQVERFPIDLYQCTTCGHVQILDVIDSDTLWDDYTYHSGQTKGIVDHFAEVAGWILGSYPPRTNSLIVDVGSNDGSLLRQFQERGLNVVGIDPAREIARNATASGIPTIAALLSPVVSDELVETHGKADYITAFNVFAHADDMNQMARCISSMLKDDGLFIFEVQYLVDIIDKFLLGTIFHEHMSHHSLGPLKLFLEKHNLELVDVERVSIQKGSIIGIAQKKGGPRPVKPSVSALLELEQSRQLHSLEAMVPFNEKLEEARRAFTTLRARWAEEGALVAAFGAARSGPTFTAQFSLGTDIKYIFDDHPQKVGKFSPGDGTPVLPTEELYRVNPQYVIILAWIHAKKIVAAHSRFLEQGGSFVVCCPNVQIIDKTSTPNLL